MSLIYITSTVDVEESVIDAVEACVPRTFACETRRLNPIAEPTYAYDSKRHQYSSSLVLENLLAFCPPNTCKLLAITNVDLFIPMLSFVYGLAQLNGKVALITLARLRQEFYGMPPNPALTLNRALKECVHELGHTFGLVHCLDRNCPMSLSTNIRQVDLKGREFCPGCAALLHESFMIENGLLKANS